MNVLVTYRNIPGAGLIEGLREHVEVRLSAGEGYMSRAELTEALKDADGVVTLLNEKIDAELMDGAPRLKVIANYAVGYNNVDVVAATERGIIVTNTPGVVTDATADLAWALLMAVARGLTVVDDFTRSGRWTEWRPELFIASDISGQTLGIVGLGRIGRAVAKRAVGFDMKILYTDVHRAAPEVERQYHATYVGMDELLQESDFVTLHVPLGEGTFHLINERALRLMKPTAYLVNVSRGSVVDEQALVRALKAGQIAGAGLDVYEDEPRLAEGLAQLENVILTPHLGANSRRTRDLMARMTVENVVAALSGRVPPNVINTDVLARRR
ncbi:MAG TPA: D-glycerate dehydrogenase [Dehalococcoidia bacterium]|nr:D-glycerate dehydrogenase [Dehalococcoidia bacterium]